jgi:hypothetical protein
VDEVGDDVRYCRAVCCHNQQLSFLGHFPFTVMEDNFFRHIRWSWSVPSYFRAIDLRHHLDGECQPDSVAGLDEDQRMLNTKTFGRLSSLTWSPQREHFCLAILRYIRVIRVDTCNLEC